MYIPTAFAMIASHDLRDMLYIFAKHFFLPGKVPSFIGFLEFYDYQFVSNDDSHPFPGGLSNVGIKSPLS